MPYRRFFRQRDLPIRRRAEMIQWASEFIGLMNVVWEYRSEVMVRERWDDWAMTPKVEFSFEREEDAVAFELRWRQ